MGSVVSEEERLLWLRDGYKTPGEKSNISQYMGKKKINLGCGAAPEPVWNGWTNVDINRRSCAGVIFDMRKEWPFKPNSFDTAFSFYTLNVFFPGEELFHVLANVWDILRPGSFFVNAVQSGSTGSPMQKSIWGERTPYLLCESVYTTSEMTTTGWDQALPVKPWNLIGVEQPDLIWFVLQKPV